METYFLHSKLPGQQEKSFFDRKQKNGNRKYNAEKESGHTEKNSRYREQQEYRLKRQCRLLGTAAVILAGVSVFTFMGRNRSERTFTNYPVMTGIHGGQSGQAGENVQETDLLILVNKDHVLSEDYEVELHWLRNGSCAVAEEMYQALCDMLSDGTDEGFQFVVASGYRDREKQKQLLEEDIAASMERYGMSWQEAYDYETRETMPPGFSEHETGLAVDIVSLNYQMLDESQERTEENRWLRENCSRYGFILRYPRGKEDITGIDYEAWHFRYVGVEAAEKIMGKGITLEEYLSIGG